MLKDSGLRIRVQHQLREEFLELCRSQDKAAAQVIREFMREYIARHKHEGTEKPPDPTPTSAESAPSEH